MSILPSRFLRSFDTFIYMIRAMDPKPKYPIHLGVEPPGNKQYIFFNTEQLTRPIVLQKIILSIQHTKPLEVWDYSTINVQILKEQGIEAKHVPLESPKWYIDKLKLWRDKIEFDVGFCGTMNKRRKMVFDKIKEGGRTVQIVPHYGDERDKRLAKCRILINIHYDESYNVFESARCEPWLQLGVIVISETSLDNDDRCINVPYGNLAKTALEHLETNS